MLTLDEPIVLSTFRLPPKGIQPRYLFTQLILGTNEPRAQAVRCKPEIALNDPRFLSASDTLSRLQKRRALKEHFAINLLGLLSHH